MTGNTRQDRKVSQDLRPSFRRSGAIVARRVGDWLARRRDMLPVRHEERRVG